MCIPPCSCIQALLYGSEDDAEEISGNRLCMFVGSFMNGLFVRSELCAP